jgi:hypothetical protein
MSAVAVIVGMLAVGALSPANAATTFTSTSYFVSLPSDTKINANDNDHFTALLPTYLNLQKGETRRLSDQVGFTISSSEGAEAENKISCVDPNTGMVDPNTQTVYAETQSADTNHPGSGGGEVVLVQSLLFTAEYTGTFQCQIMALVGDGDRTDFYGTATKSGLPYTTNGTWLKVSSTNEVGAHSWDNDTCGPHGNETDSHGRYSCVYVGGPGDFPAFHMFVDGVQRDIWTAANDATTVDVVGNIRVTSCPHGTRSCRPDQWGSTGYAQIGSYLTVNQLYPNGTLCRQNQVSGGGATYIDNAMHHYALSYHTTVPVSPNCGGSRQFAPEWVGWWENGNPVKVDDGNVNVLNQVRTTTATVPNVLGSTEAQAKAVIQAAGLTANTIGHVANPAPAGTVFAQNAPDGTVEPTGSAVDITVSTGAALTSAAMARNADGRLEMFAVNGLHGIWYQSQVTAGSDVWSGWKLFTGTLTTVAAETNGNGQIEVFGVDDAGKVFHRWQLSANSDNWSSWVEFGGSLSHAPSAITVTRAASGGLTVFGVNSNGQLYGRVQYTAPNGGAKGTWSAWDLIDGNFATIAAQTNANGQIELFGVSKFGKISHRWELTPGTGSWSAWESFGGGGFIPYATTITVATSGTGQLEVFGTNSAGQIFARAQHTVPGGGGGTWSDWIQIDGSLVGIAADSTTEGRIELIGANGGGALYGRQQILPYGADWTPWATLYHP